MRFENPALRRPAQHVVRLAAAASAVLLAASAVAVVVPPPPADAATNAGAAEVITPRSGSGGGQPLEEGGSETEFSLKLPDGAACSGDSNDGYRVQSYHVPASVDPGTLTFGPFGPTGAPATGQDFRQPLWQTDGTPYVDAGTAPADSPGGPGAIINIPAFYFGVYGDGDIPPGDYLVGLACTKGPEGPAQLDKYWVVEFTFEPDASDPIGVRWSASVAQPPPPPTTTTSPSTTTTAPGGGSTTTTAPIGTTTTTQVSSDAITTTTLSSVLGSSTGDQSGSGALGLSSSGSTTASTTGSSNPLASTGETAVDLALWGSLLAVFGRFAVLLGREPAVTEDGEE